MLYVVLISCGVFPASLSMGETSWRVGGAAASVSGADRCQSCGHCRMSFKTEKERRKERRIREFSSQRESLERRIRMPSQHCKNRHSGRACWFCYALLQVQVLPFTMFPSNFYNNNKNRVLTWYYSYMCIVHSYICTGFNIISNIL